MKKALVITYYWPPSGGAGVQRWLKFVKYMREFGWEPVVYTADGGEMPVTDLSLQKDIPAATEVIRRKIWEPYRFYKIFSGRKPGEKINAAFLTERTKPGLVEKLSVWIRGNLFIPDARRFWIRPSAAFLSKYLAKNPVDCIISTGPPHSMHLIALRLKQKFPHLPWVADFRDPWTQIDFYDKLMLSKMADRLHRKMERRVLSSADRVISVGPTMGKALQELAEGQDEKFAVIPNGYDEDDLLKGTVTPDLKFSIAHVGTLVNDRNPSELWRVLSKLIAERPEFKAQLEIRLVGKVDIRVREDIEKHGLTGFVRYISYLPHDQVIAEQQRSRVLLLLVNRTANSRSILTGKLFEYMSSGRPILAIGPKDGDLSVILRASNTGLISDFGDEKKLEANVLSLFAGASLIPDRAEIAKYSRRELTRSLCSVLDGLSGVRQG
jgi:glycosyltransferase involved in cell wall biosynthesis